MILNQKIYLKLDKQPDTIKELLLNLFAYGIYCGMTAVCTYSDEECTIVQCNEGKLRSFDDIFDIVNTYFENTNEEVVMFELLTLDFNLPNPLYIMLSHCAGIKRIRLHYGTGKVCGGYDVFGIKTYDSKWSWDYLLGKLNINNKEELEKFVNYYIEKQKLNNQL